MYDLKGFGKRIEELRKSKAMTQENLAERLGVTAQAVSKWENGLCYPDIESIPTICAIFEIGLEDIFGKVKKDLGDMKFPHMYKGVPFVYSFSNIGCYSDKTPDETDGSNVKFKDGSSAELSSRRIVNKGARKILLRAMDENSAPEETAKKPKDTKINCEFGKAADLECAIPCGNCAVTKANGDKTAIYAEGYPEFIDMLEFEYKNECSLAIKYDREKRDKLNREIEKWDTSKNKIEISLAYEGERIKNLAFSVDGSGDIKSSVPSEKAKFSINGSGNIEAPACFGDLAASINGSGEITFKTAEKLEAKINGSGDIHFENAEICGLFINGSGDMKFEKAESCTAKINGSGDIGAKSVGNLAAKINGAGDMKFAECQTIEAEINGSGDFDVNKITKKIKMSIRGSGDVNFREGEVEIFEAYLDNGAINAKGVAAERAKIEIPNKGKVEIGRVKIESVEKCGERAEVIIHERG